MASDAIRSIRSKAATTAPSGAPRAGTTVASRTYARRRAAARSATRRRWVSARWLPVGAGSDRSGSLDIAGRPSRGLPGMHLDAGVGQPVGQLPPDRHLDPDEVDPGADEVRRLLDRRRDIRLVQGQPEPGPRRLAEHVDRLAPDRPLGVDPFDREPGQPRRLDLRDRPPVALAQELGLEREVDRARRDVERQLLRLEVVFEQGHGERQGDPGRERARVAGQPAVDRRAGQRPPAGGEPGHPEQAQDRPLLADRRRRPRSRAP